MKRVLLFSILILLNSFLFAEARTALLIANGKYKNFGNLATPVNEARELKKSLEKLGFSVTIVENAGREKITDSLYDFQKKLEAGGGIGFFHYGGHAVQVNGKNYLIPVDADIPDERRVASRSIDVDEVMTSMMADTNIVILDACRNNPLPASSGRSATRGLVLSEYKPKNSIIVYSAQPGKVAQDGIFTPILTAKLLEKKEFSSILKDVRKEVSLKTNGEQNPGEYNELVSDVYLAGNVSPIEKNDNANLTNANSSEKNISNTNTSKNTGISYVDLANKAYSEGDYKLAFEYFSKADEITDTWSQGNLGWLYHTGEGGFQNYAKAFEWYMKAAKQGDSFSQNKIGVFYFNGYGVGQNYKEAITWYEKAAAQNDPYALGSLGYMYCEGLGCKKDYKKAKKYFESAAAQGNIEALYNIGYLYQNGFGVKVDMDKAVEYYEKSAAQGYELASHAINNLNIELGKKAYEEGKYSIAFSYFSKAENLYDAQAQYYMGKIYSDWNEPVDWVKAKYWYELSAEQGNSYGLNALGWLYFNGYAVEKDISKAITFYEKAAAQENEMAYNNLGICYRDGVGVKQDYGKAREFFEKAAAQNCENAEYGMGLLYANGFSVTQDFKKAKEWYEKAADKGYANAQCELGFLYENGYGVTKDLSTAKSWYEKAAAQNNEYSKQALERLK